MGSTRRRLTGWTLAGVLAVAVALPAVGGTSVAVAASVGGVVNTYQAVSAVSGTTVTVTGATRGASAPFAVGDRVMLIQMTGVSPAQAGSNFGNYDTATITAVSGSTITLDVVARTYSPASEAVQLVRMPYDAGSTTIDSIVSAAAWNGATGGVVALAGGALTLNSDIDASATGFTNDFAPTGAVVPSLSFGPGSATGRGHDGGPGITYLGPESGIAFGGGGLGGGGGANEKEADVYGGGRGGGGASGAIDGGIAVPGPAAPGSDGGAAQGEEEWNGAAGAAGGGGGILGGGGGGGAASSGAGGGTDGGGGGGDYRSSNDFGPPDYWVYGLGAGGGGPRGVGNGGDGLEGGENDWAGGGNEGSAGGGGGSYGGGGGAPSNLGGGDDSAGGGGGGSWTGGGAGGLGGVFEGWDAIPDTPYPAGGDGNDAVAAPIPDDAHYLNTTNPRLMMGGAGGRGSQEAGYSQGGAGGGIVFLDFLTIGGSGDVRADGGDGASPAGGGAHSGSGGGGGGQMRIRANTLDNPLTFAVNGGVGGEPTADLYHGGVSGGGGGAGGVWVELLGAEPTCPAENVPDVTFELAGGNGGPSIVNPKNGLPTGTGGDGGSGLGCVTPKLVPTGSIELSKVVDDPFPGDEDGDAATFPILVECTDPAGGDPIVREVELDRDGTPVLVEDLPADAVCTLTETDTDGGEVSFDPDGPVTVGDGTTVSVVVTNTFPMPSLEWSFTKEAFLDGTLLEQGAQVLPGDTLTYEVGVQSAAEVDIEDIVLTDDLTDVLDDASFVAGSAQLVVDGGAPVAVADPVGASLSTAPFTLPPGATATLSYQVVVNEDAWSATLTNVVTGESPTEPPTNPPGTTTQVTPDEGRLQWNKVDDASRVLAGSAWELTPLDGAGQPDGDVVTIVDCTEGPCSGADTDPEAGQFLIVALLPGEYQLVETKAPAGYILNSTPIVVTVLDGDTVTVLDDIVNVQQGVPAIPLTGGLGADHYLLAGGALAVLAVLLEIWRRRRRTTQEVL